jgi:N6-L-threonylcarbamoyladenine synthase
VVDTALGEAGVSKNQVNAVAYTRGPGLLGSLLVGSSFAKGFAAASGIPMIDVNHLEAHIMVHFLTEGDQGDVSPPFPFICLLVSGGHTQLVLVESSREMKILGGTIDDAAGEAFDKCAKLMGLPYPGGPHVDRWAREGDPDRFKFSKPKMKGYDFSFSGLKTSFLYFLRDRLKEDQEFVEKYRKDLAASLQKTIVSILMDKLIQASGDTGIREVALAGGVSANSGLREALLTESRKRKWDVYVPPLKFTTDNAAMIAIAGYYKLLDGEFASEETVPLARMYFGDWSG